ncbi:MAG: GFA family protein [Sphingomonadaceae bacterium]
MTTMTGGCACGRVRYTAQVEDGDAYLCHCRRCRRATGSVSIAYKHLPLAAVRWESPPDWYRSSPIARRPYCAACGTSLGFVFDEGEDMDLTVGSFDDPSCFRPRWHFGAVSLHEAWGDTGGLPRRRTTDYEPLVEHWMKTLGKLPE